MLIKMPIMTGTTCGGAASDNSETSDDGSSFSPGGSDKSDKTPENICRDFLRNVCKRGKRCKYRHPDNSEAKELGRRLEYTFCHDYQNSVCRRPSCKFIHCTREEEEYYRQTGQLPVRLQQAAAMGIGIMPSELPVLKGEVPICKDYLKGECKRAGRCKFRHLTATQYDLELRRANRRVTTAVVERYESFTEDVERYDYEISAKRRKTEETLIENNNYEVQRALTRATYVQPDYRLLEEENILLRRKVEELKKQATGLMATNEVLLEQNARFRTGTKMNAVTTAPPLVTVSQVVMTPTVSHAPSIMRPTTTCHMPPIAAPQPIIPLPTTITALPQLTLDANNELVVSQQALQPRLACAPELAHAQTAQTLAAATADLVQQAAAAAGTITAAPATITQPPPQANMVPISMVTGGVSVSTHPRVSITGTQVTHPRVSMTQVTRTNLDTGNHGNTPVSIAQTSLAAQTLIGSGHNTALVSYPIISHTPAPLANGTLG